jgi:hypothetical protein
VKAKDKDTGKEAKIEIKGCIGISGEEVDRSFEEVDLVPVVPPRTIPSAPDV